MLVVGPLTSEFRSTVAEIPKCMVWMRLHELPPPLWTQSVLSLIVAKVKTLVRLDDCTELLTKGSYAQVAVEINLSKPLLPGTNIT